MKITMTDIVSDLLNWVRQGLFVAFCPQRRLVTPNRNKRPGFIDTLLISAGQVIPVQCLLTK